MSIRISDLLGVKWFDRVPLLIPLSWFTMAVPAFALSYFTFRHSSQVFVRIIFGALLLTVWDLSLDPAMSYLTTYWNWGESGPFYGMPWNKSIRLVRHRYRTHGNPSSAESRTLDRIRVV